MSDVKSGQIEKNLLELVEMKDKLANARAVLRQFKVRSERLTQLKRAVKDIKDQMEDEKKRIEDEFLEDENYEKAANEELTLKNEIKEKNGELRDLLKEVNKSQDLSTYEYNIKGEPVKLQVERVVKVYLNGREEK
jgi:uncharacterized protein involved in exopolysaccharide biosynthesis